MKKRLLITLAATVVVAGSLHAQIIKNGAMESWQTNQVDEPSGWFTSNREGASLSTTTKTTDSHSGLAIKLETKDDDGDLMFGYFINTQGNPESGEGGVPYSQKPANITGWYKSDIMAGDSAIILVVFKKAGMVVSMDVFKLTGQHNTYTQFSFPLSLSVVPDSVILAVASSNALSEVGVAEGSTVTIDDLSFSGTGITQPIPGGDFETWLSVVFNTLDDWFTYGDRNSGVGRTASSYKGDYATILLTQGDGGNAYGSGITNRNYDDGGMGGVPYTHMNDTLMFWYKYTPQGTDSAMASVSLSNNGMPVGGSFIKLGAAATYTKVVMPLSAMTAPDSMSINISSSMNNPVEGSLLWVDEVQLASEPLNTGLSRVFKSNSNFAIYPNPFTESIELILQGQPATLNYTLNDVTGKVVTSGKGSTINTNELCKGIYFITVSDGTQTLAVKKIVKE